MYADPSDVWTQSKKGPPVGGPSHENGFLSPFYIILNETTLTSVGRRSLRRHIAVTISCGLGIDCSSVLPIWIPGCAVEIANLIVVVEERIPPLTAKELIHFVVDQDVIRKNSPMECVITSVKLVL